LAIRPNTQLCVGKDLPGPVTSAREQDSPNLEDVVGETLKCDGCLNGFSTPLRQFHSWLGAFERTLDMIPTVTSPGAAPPPAPTQSAQQKTALPQADTARSSAGESTAANIRAETARAVDAPEQTAVAPRLREQESKERPESVFDDLVGPEPTFEENVLERQARVALDPPEAATPEAEAPEPVEAPEQAEIEEVDPPVFEDSPPTPTERAEKSFAETRSLADSPEPATVDVAR
jgi:hypothetical protein